MAVRARSFGKGEAMRLLGALATVIFLATGAGLCSDMEESLVAHWRLDGDLDPTAWDDGPHGLHGTAYDVTYGRGGVGLAAVFDDTGDKVLIRDETGLAPLQVGELAYGTIAVWFRYQSFDGQISPIFYFGEADTGTRHNSLIIEIGHGNNLKNRKLYFTIINTRFCYDSRVNLEPGRWYHFAAVVGPEGNTGYLDGCEIKRITVVDDDVDIRDPMHLDWALNSRMNPARDVSIIDNIFARMDPAVRVSGKEVEMSSKLLIDATDKSGRSDKQTSQQPPRPVPLEIGKQIP